jgi:hypothetical protein
MTHTPSLAGNGRGRGVWGPGPGRALYEGGILGRAFLAGGCRNG